MTLKKSYELWSAAILSLFLLSQYYDKALADSEDDCDFESDLVTNHSFIQERVRMERGLYIFTQGLSCVGTVTLLEICGDFSEKSLVPRHYFAAVYNTLFVNGTKHFERVSNPEHIDINPSIVVSGTCAQSVVNMQVKRGQTIGFSFVDECQTELFAIGFSSNKQEVLVCPVHAALQTNNTEDKVYFSSQLSVDNETFTKDDLSLLTGVRVNIRGFIELSPPLFSEVCMDSSLTVIDHKQQTGIISKPTEVELLTIGGTYIMAETTKCDGIVNSISYCGFLNPEGYFESDLDITHYYVLWLQVRRVNDTFDIINQEFLLYDEDIMSVDRSDRSLSANLRCDTQRIPPWEVLKGDQFGVQIISECYLGFCPFQMGLNNTGCDSQQVSLFEPDYYSPGPFKQAIPINDTTLVAVKINAQFVFYESCGANSRLGPSHLALSYGATAVSLIVTAFMVIIVIVLIVQLKRKRPHILGTINRQFREGSNRIRNTLRDSFRRRNEVDTTNVTLSQSFRNRTFPEQNDYSVNIGHATNDASSNSRNDRTIHHQAALLSGSYDTPIDDISRRRLHTDEPLYCDPPCEEAELKNDLQKLEVLKDNITLKEYLGSGQFGVVYRGLVQLTGDGSEAEVMEVAVKSMETGANEEQRVKFLQEAAIMGQFINDYIVKIYGVVTSSHPYMILCELMNGGDLRRYLYTIKLSSTQSNEMFGQMCLGFSRQIANAMEYLSGKGFVHRDLAARNILVSTDGICKVADFGLSRDLQDEDYYISHGGLVPVRWTAPEALKYRKYSIASDVWSFGIVLYEIWSLACKPYSTLTNEQVLKEVMKGQRLSSPPGCPKAIYTVMISCWHPETIHRPLFSQLHTCLQQSDTVLLEWSEEDMTLYSENARTIGATYEDGECLYTDLQNKYCVV